MPPTTARFDTIRPVKLCAPITILANGYIDRFFDRFFTILFVSIKLYGLLEIVSSILDVPTIYLDLVEIIQTLL